jgi:hypothetical protein
LTKSVTLPGSKYVGIEKIYHSKRSLLSFMSYNSNKNTFLFRCSRKHFIVYLRSITNCSNFRLSRSTRNVFCCPHKKVQCIIAKIHAIRSIITQKHISLFRMNSYQNVEVENTYVWYFNYPQYEECISGYSKLRTR